MLSLPYNDMPIGYYISNSCGVPFAYEVKPKTVGQYTGCKDKNKKEIYDGDIIKLGGADRFYVEFMCGAYLLCWQTEMFIHRNKMLADFTSNEMEIMGNIYEHPERINDSGKDGENE